MKRFAPLSMAILLIASNVTAADKWWDYYKRGTVAVAKSDWPTVADQMLKSIALKPEEELAAKARRETLIYVPHYWLGTARFNLGDFDGAIREWDISQNQRVVQKTQYYSELRSYLARAQAQKAKGVAALSADDRKAAESALNKAISSQVEAISGGGDRSETYRLANRRLQEAWAQFNKAGNDPKAYARAAETAVKSRELFAAAAAEAASRKVAKATPRVVVPPQASAQTSPQAGSVAPPPAPAPQQTTPEPAIAGLPKDPAPTRNPDLDKVRSLLAQFRQRLDDAARRGSVDSDFNRFVRTQNAKVQQWTAALDQDPARKKTDEIANEVAALDRELSRRLTRVATITGTPATAVKRHVLSEAVRAELRKGYVAYASGSLEESEAILTRIVAKDPRADEAYLLRGVVRFTRLTLSGEKNVSMDDASADFRAALDRDGTLTLDPVYFSPKLIAFFGQVRQSRE